MKLYIIFIIIISVTALINNEDQEDHDYGLDKFQSELEDLETLYDSDIEKVLQTYNDDKDDTKNEADISDEHWNNVADNLKVKGDTEFLSVETSDALIGLVNGQDYFTRFDQNISNLIKEQSDNYCLPLISRNSLHPGAPTLNGGWDWLMSLQNDKMNIPSFDDNQRRCDFDVVDARNITAKELNTKYFDQMIPVLIINGVNEQWKQQFRKSVLTDELGSLNILYGHKPPHHHMNKMRLNEFVNKFMRISKSADLTNNYLYPPYAWDDIAEVKEESEEIYSIQQDIFSIISQLPKLCEQEFGDSLQYISIGPPCSGSHLHHHSAALNILGFGLKRWALFPSKHSSYLVDNKYQSNIPNIELYNNNVHPLDWFHQILPKLKNANPKETLECYQQSGDMLFVPNFWHHAVLNIHSSTAISYERPPSNNEIAIDAFLNMDKNHDGHVIYDEFISFINHSDQNLIVLPPDDEEDVTKLKNMLENKELDDVIAKAWKILAENANSFDMNQCINRWEEANQIVDTHVFGY